MRRDQWAIVALLAAVLIGLLLYAAVRSMYPPIVPQYVPTAVIVLPAPSYTPTVTPTPEPTSTPTMTVTSLPAVTYTPVPPLVLPEPTSTRVPDPLPTRAPGVVIQNG